MISALASRIRAALTGEGPPRDRFTEVLELYRDRLERFPPPAAASAPAPHVGILITQWHSTGVPFFLLELGQMLVRSGLRVTAIHDEADVVGNAPFPEHTRGIEEILTRLTGALTVLEMQDQPAGEPDTATAEALLRENAIWRMRGESKVDEFLTAHPEAGARLAGHLGKVERMLAAQAFDWILIPGGIFGLSGVYVAAARRVQMDFSTFDAGVGLLRLAQRNVAAHLGDLPAVFAEVRGRWNDAERAHVQAWVAKELRDRAAGTDSRQFQVAAATEQATTGVDVLVPLNIRWDSAALGRQRVFASVEEWLEALLTWIGQRPGVTITIREHPRGRLSFARSTDDWEPLLQRFAGLGERLRFVRCDDPVNTYDLLRGCKVVLPHTSTIGLEASMLGKPVVLGTQCYYQDFGFVWPAMTREEYFARIDEALAGRLTLSREQREDAALAFYITQRCALNKSVLNPHVEDMREWCGMAPAEIWARPELADLQEALLSRRPMPVLRYERLVRDAV